MGVVLAPVLEGKLVTWKAWCQELNGPRAQELKEFNRRHNLTRHAAWLAQTPSGPAVIALHEGPGSDDFMKTLGSSNHEFDGWSREKIKEIHGFDLTQPPPGPLPEIYLDSGS